MSGKYVVCCGMGRSGGTAQYQMVKALVERKGLGKGDGFGIHYDSAQRPAHWVVVKSEYATKWMEPVKRGYGVAIGIYRDPRDVAASMMEFRRRKGELGFRERGWTFDQHIIPGFQEVMDRWRAWESVVAYAVAYEQAIQEWPYVVMQMAQVLGIEILPGEAIDIASEWCIQRNAARCDGMEQWIDSNDTMLTKAHVGERRGMVGRWKHDLTTEQAAQIEDIAGKGWMVGHGYSLLDRQ